MERRERTAKFARIVSRARNEIGADMTPPVLEIVLTDRLAHRWDAVYRRDGAGYILELPTFARLASCEKAATIGPAYLYWLMHCPPEVEHMSVTLSDGDQSGWAMFSPSTSQPQQVPIPDPYFFRYRGYEWAMAHALGNDVPWSARSPDIVWRGASSGLHTFDPVVGTASPLMATQRLALCLAARGIAGVDVALAIYARDELKEEVLRACGVVKKPIPEESWTGRKFAIDVDGQTNSWSNLLIRMHFGCCVLKVASRHGFRQWYYDQLRPWEHYVPVKADLSDFREQIEWVRANDGHASEIAASGRSFARALTFEAGRQQAVELITKHWRSDNPYGPRTWPPETAGTLPASPQAR